MNRIGKIKALILALGALFNILNPRKIPLDQHIIFDLIGPLIFGSLAIPFIILVNSIFRNWEIIKPNWNDNPLIFFKRPMIMVQFAGYFFLIVGAGVIIGALIKYARLNTFGLAAFMYGVGILIGIKLTLLWSKPNFKKVD